MGPARWVVPLSAALLLLRYSVEVWAQRREGAWVIPGVTPTSYERNMPLNIKVNSLTSVQHIMPFEWYSLPFCAPPRPDLQEYMQTPNLGEILWGDKIEISLYRAPVLANISCHLLCPVREYTEHEMAQFENRVEQWYRGNMVLDHLPVAEEGTGGSALHSAVLTGFPLGVPRRQSTTGHTLLHNHLAFTVAYSTLRSGTRPAATSADMLWQLMHPDPPTYRVVGFRVTPYSVDHDGKPCPPGFNPASANPLPTSKTSVAWTYSVSWVEDKTTDWGTRWDVYLRSTRAEARIHWFAIINSLLVVVILSAVVAVIMLRLLHRDFNRYNRYLDPDNEEEAQEETGWKLVHGDVFRQPANYELLVVYVATGTQLLGMSVATISFAVLGFLSPANRGALLFALIFLSVLLGSLAGFTAGRMLTAFGMHDWRWVFATGLYFPGQVFSTWFVLNQLMWAKHSASAVPFSTIGDLMALWLGVSLLLVILAASVELKRPPLQFPCQVQATPRPIPPQPWYLRTPQAYLLAGVLPFGATFVESVFILSLLWQGRVYYVFGFLALVFVILVVTVAETTIVMVYFQLAREDWRWWWRSFLTGGSYGLWFFLYCAKYYYSALSIPSFWSSVLYFGYMGLVSYFFFVITGTIGFLAALLFTLNIYRSIKVD